VRVLLCDDDLSILHTIGEYLEMRHIEVDYSSRGREAVALATAQPFDVIVLDVKMPGMTGLEACRNIRAAGVLTPILFLTARDSLADTIAGFAAGGDDYLVKPFAFEELYVRIDALSRRLSRQGQSVITIGDLRMDLQTNEVSRAGERLHLNPIQFSVLKCLATKSPGVVTRSELQQFVWGDDVPESDALRTHIFNLRSIMDKPFPTALLHTVHGVGFKLCAMEALEA